MLCALAKPLRLHLALPDRVYGSRMPVVGPISLPPEVLEPIRRQRPIDRRARDRPMLTDYRIEPLAGCSALLLILISQSPRKQL